MAADTLFYNTIFFTNILHWLDEQGMTKKDLAEKSGVSLAFLSDITTGKANPSLKNMEHIANALELPLPLLLESTDLDSQTLEALAGGKPFTSLPKGYQRVSVVLPDYRAFQVKKWGEETRRKLQDGEI
ncbi:MAG: transcriptional regulator [Burkholderiaceae bacterium]|nr:transcriptional regulator [Burkholderiaceae bacterium]